MSYPKANTEAIPINICVLGELGVGKSSLVLQYTKSYFPTNMDPEVEDSYSKDIIIGNDVFRLNILDTANPDNYSPLKEIQLKEADGVMIVFDVNNLRSYEAASNIFSQVLRVKESVPPALLVGNRIDLNDARHTGLAEGEKLAEELGIAKYIETSAKNNINVSNSFEYLFEKILESKNIITSSSTETNAPQVNNEEIQKQLKKSTFTTGSNFEVLSESSDNKQSDFNIQTETAEAKSITSRTQRLKQKSMKAKEEGSSSTCCVIA